METMASSIFRRYFAKLDAPTVVTVNGHPIGTWHPAGPYMEEAAKRDGTPAPVYPEAGSYFTAGDAQRLLKLTPKERQAQRGLGVVMRNGRMVAVEDIEDAPRLAAIGAHLLDQTPQARRDEILRKINRGR